MEIANLNNQGVAFLNKGELKRSLPAFRMALKQTLSQLSEQELYSSSLVQRSRPVANSSSKFSKENKRVSDHIHSNENVAEATKYLALDPLLEEDSMASMSYPFVQCHGISIVGVQEGALCVATSVKDAVITASIVLFNLGLTYHLKGLQDNSSRHLLIAESHYNRSISMLVETGVNIVSANAVLDFVAMALRNNLAQIRFELCDYPESKAHIGRLLQLLSSIDSERYGDVAMSSFMNRKKLEFFLNATFLRQGSNSAPSA